MQKQIIPFIDLKTQYEAIKPDIQERINRVLDHGQYVMGPEIFELEEKLAEYVGVKHCIAASSGTDTLLIAMMALGINPGDEVITTPFTFIATGEMIALIGAIPVFVDIDPRTYNIDPSKIEAAITSKTKAIMPVSLYGQCADMGAINAIADKYNLPVIEDAAQSFGATYNGKKSCGLSTIGSASFFPSKPLGAYGDGGALFTDDDNLAKLMREIRLHGQDRHYHHPRIGINGRMDTIQAAVGNAETLLTQKGGKLGRDFSNSEEVLMVAKNLERLAISTFSTGFKITPSLSKRLIFACAVFARWAHRLGHHAAKELLHQISARSGDSTYFLARIAQKTIGSDAHQIESMFKKVERSDCLSASKAKQRLLMIKWPKPIAALRIYLWFFKKRRQRCVQYRTKSLRDLNCLLCEAELKFPYSFRKQQRAAGSQSSLY